MLDVLEFLSRNAAVLAGLSFVGLWVAATLWMTDQGDRD